MEEYQRSCSNSFEKNVHVRTEKKWEVDETGSNELEGYWSGNKMTW